MVENFLRELRESADLQFVIFTQGSCYRLGMILKTIFPEAVIYWSDLDNHAIVRIDGVFYDIGGVIKDSYANNNGYYPVREEQHESLSKLKWLPDHSISVPVNKYI